MGYTQTDLAELLSIKPNSISNYENSVSEPTIDQVYQLIKIFDISADKLLYIDLEFSQSVVSEPVTEYKTTGCPLCKEKERVIKALEESNGLLKKNISALENELKRNNESLSQTA